MSVWVLLEAQVQSDKIAEVKSSLAQNLPDTRSFAGCQGIDALFNMDAPEKVVVVEKWESRSHYDKYLQWRQESGLVDKMSSMLVGPLTIQYYERADA